MNATGILKAVFLVMTLSGVVGFGPGISDAFLMDVASRYNGLSQAAPEARNQQREARDTSGWTIRVITRQELERLGQRDWDLSPSYAKRLLARLNARDFDYIDEDIRQGRAIRVPNNFSAFKSWTPLPRYLPELATVPKFILIAKDIPFIGWYEKGRLVGDTYICIGREEDWTAAGIYTVKEKDRNHFSRSYPNAWGDPAPMPWALRIYGLVWIHAGDIVGAHCSRGCINLPIEPAAKLFDWAPQGTPVMIVDALGDYRTVIARNKSNCSVFASACATGMKRVNN